MASTNQQNGNPPPRHRSLTPSRLRPASRQCQKRARSVEPDHPPLLSSLQPENHQKHTYTSYDGKGRLPFARPAASTNGSGPSWDPSSLLNPKGHGITPAKTKDQQRSPANSANTANHMTFHFSTPGGTPNSAFQSPATTPAPEDVNGNSQDAPAGGMSRMIERMNNVQERSSFPLPKRRKIEENNDDISTASSFRSGGNGMLGEYVRQQREQMQPTPALKSTESVDLTGGESGPRTPRQYMNT